MSKYNYPHRILQSFSLIGTGVDHPPPVITGTSNYLNNEFNHITSTTLGVDKDDSCVIKLQSDEQGEESDDSYKKPQFITEDMMLKASPKKLNSFMHNNNGDITFKGSTTGISRTDAIYSFQNNPTISKLSINNKSITTENVSYNKQVQQQIYDKMGPLVSVKYAKDKRKRKYHHRRQAVLWLKILGSQ